LVRYWVLILILVSALCFTLNSSALVFITALIFQLFICSVLVLPWFASFHQLLEQRHPVRFFCAWILGTFFAYFGMGFLQNFYPTYWDFIILGIPVTIFSTLAWDIILEYVMISFHAAWREKVIPLGALGVGVAFILLTTKLLIAYARLFSFNFFLPISQLTTVFLGVAILSQSWSAFLINRLSSNLVHLLQLRSVHPFAFLILRPTHPVALALPEWR
jgi:hypothetical protein